ncbi:MAG: hypothetical protein ACLSAP_11525 [Oscillospiraceae bacterium]
MSGAIPTETADLIALLPEKPCGSPNQEIRMAFNLQADCCICRRKEEKTKQSLQRTPAAEHKNRVPATA